MLNVGDSVPNFTLPLVFADGKKDPVEFKSLLGKGPVVLAFYPLAFTAPCTKEICDIRDNHAFLDRVHANRVSFSVDTPQSNIAFAKENKLQHGIYCDPNHQVVDKIWQTATIGGVERRAKRGWMVVDAHGKVVEKWVSDDPGVWSGFGPIEAALSKAQ